MRKIFTVLLIILVILYPFVVYFGMQHLSPRYVALLIGVVFICRFILLTKRNISKNSQLLTLGTVVIGLIISVISLFANSESMIRLYPVCVNVLMLAIFGYSFLYPPTIIERLARLREPELPDKAIRYIRGVTLIWCLFFVLNGSISFITVSMPIEIWTFYNGFLSYVLMGCLFAIEFLVRIAIKRKLRDY